MRPMMPWISVTSMDGVLYIYTYIYILYVYINSVYTYIYIIDIDIYKDSSSTCVKQFAKLTIECHHDHLRPVIALHTHR